MGGLADTMGSPGGIDTIIPSSMFADVDMLEEDALDAILAHANGSNGNLLSFEDGIDEAMLEEVSGSAAAAARDLGLVEV
jgi:hypothetical protein